MGRLTKEHLSVLQLACEAPFYGFTAGSNMWPLTVMETQDGDIDGEIIDDLLRNGLLVTGKLPEPRQGERSPDLDYAPHLEFDYEIFITAAGRAALAEGKPAAAKQDSGREV
ncbi:MAG: hypothetical protein BGN85_08925 [Alphaproteobacteria bacterium 64-11]|nr:MAG: hypothetical protein BGN85_08925 [Alphaproteobacteria bacterium 64-11]